MRCDALVLASLLTISLCTATNAMAADPADTILTNATIYGYEYADTIAIDDGNIVFVGSAEVSATYRDKKTEVIDLKLAYVMPGFVDNHNHVFEAASEAGGSC